MASTPRWSESELQNLRTLLLSRQLRHSDVEHFPGRSMYGLKRKAQQLRAAMGIARPSRGRAALGWGAWRGHPAKDARLLGNKRGLRLSIAAQAHGRNGTAQRHYAAWQIA